MLLDNHFVSKIAFAVFLFCVEANSYKTTHCLYRYYVSKKFHKFTFTRSRWWTTLVLSNKGVSIWLMWVVFFLPSSCEGRNLKWWDPFWRMMGLHVYGDFRDRLLLNRCWPELKLWSLPTLSRRYHAGGQPGGARMIALSNRYVFLTTTPSQNRIEAIFPLSERPKNAIFQFKEYLDCPIWFHVSKKCGWWWWCNFYTTTLYCVQSMKARSGQLTCPHSLPGFSLHFVEVFRITKFQKFSWLLTHTCMYFFAKTPFSSHSHQQTSILPNLPQKTWILLSKSQKNPLALFNFERYHPGFTRWFSGAKGHKTTHVFFRNVFAGRRDWCKWDVREWKSGFFEQ